MHLPTLVLLILVFAPAGSRMAQGARDIGSRQDSRYSAEITGLRTEWTNNLHLKKLDQFVMLYAPNATFMTSGKRVTGRTAIRELTKEAMDSFTSDIALRSITTECSGDFAYDSGDYHETLISNSDGSKTSVSGDDLTIYHWAIDHKWLNHSAGLDRSFETVAWSGDHTSIK